LSILNQLIVNRIGNKPEASMLTRDIIGHFSPNVRYQVISNKTSPDEAISLVECHVKKPIHTSFRGIWEKDETTKHTSANILGGMGTLYLNNSDLTTIPVITATAESLAFYHAKLIHPGEELQFETRKNLPLTDTFIGEDYISGYLTHNAHGGGDYIEYHNEPHLWIPNSRDSAGHILLGRQEEDVFYLTGFSIPFGCGVYLSPYALHSDAYLIGHYKVVYTVAEHYSTVIFKNHENQPIKLSFDYTCKTNHLKKCAINV